MAEERKPRTVQEWDLWKASLVRKPILPVIKKSSVEKPKLPPVLPPLPSKYVKPAGDGSPMTFQKLAELQAKFELEQSTKKRCSKCDRILDSHDPNFTKKHMNWHIQQDWEKNEVARLKSLHNKSSLSATERQGTIQKRTEYVARSNINKARPNSSPYSRQAIKG